MMARPTDCTPDTIARVCEALELGVSWAAAAAHAGLAEQTLITWRKRGQTGKKPFAEFLERATRARDAAETRMAAIVMQSALEGNVGAAMWWLERRRRETWGKTQDVQIQTSADDGVKRLLDRLASSGGGDHGQQ
jgi:hypothetical protein